MYYYDPTVILVIPAILFVAFAQFKVKSAYNKYSGQANRRGVTGAEAARRILDMNGLQSVPVETVQGRLSDHYHPGKRAVRLSAEVHDGASVAALSIAAHEVGHAIQHAGRYPALTLRSIFAPVATVSSTMAWIFVIGGIVIASSAYPVLGSHVIDVGIILYVAVVLFQLITLPVEFNASKRAKTLLAAAGFVSETEIVGVNKVLSAAAMTYVAALVSTVMTLVRLLLIRDRR